MQLLIGKLARSDVSEPHYYLSHLHICIIVTTTIHPPLFPAERFHISQLLFLSISEVQMCLDSGLMQTLFVFLAVQPVAETALYLPLLLVDIKQRP